MTTRRFVVEGKVQNVGFRDYVRALALSLSLTGEVWNCRDGKVGVLLRARKRTLPRSSRNSTKDLDGWSECPVKTPPM